MPEEKKRTCHITTKVTLRHTCCAYIALAFDAGAVIVDSDGSPPVLAIVVSKGDLDEEKFTVNFCPFCGREIKLIF